MARRTGRRLAVVGMATAMTWGAACSSTTTGSSPATTAATTTAAAPTGSTAAGSSTTTGTAAPRPAPPVAPPPGALTWAPCPANGEGAECATLGVPLDYEHPAEEQITVAVSRIKAADPATRLGVLLFNPGGPGGRGLDLPGSIVKGALGNRAASPLPGAGAPTTLARPADSGADIAMLRRFDLIGFDPRGVGASSPVDCGDLAGLDQADYEPKDEAGKQALVATMKAFAAGCATHSGKLLGFVDTESAAHDLDQLRIALGEEKLNLFGFSYGTSLFSIYADSFPDRVRAAVLDGAELPKADGVALIQEQGVALDALLEKFLGACAARPDCPFFSGGDPGKALDALQVSLAAKPLDTPSGPLTVGQATTVVAGAMFSKEVQPLLEVGLAQAAAGDGSLAAAGWALYHGRTSDPISNLSEATVAINCLDFVWPQDDAGYDALVKETERRAPRLGSAFLREVLPCAYWPVPPRPRAVPVAEGAPPILVVGTTGDPSTPYAWSEQMAESLADGHLLTRDGDGHTAWSESRCIDEAIDAYLVTLALPAPGTRCATP